MTRSKSARLRHRRKQQKHTTYPPKPQTADLASAGTKAGKVSIHVVSDVPAPLRGLKKRCFCGRSFWTMKSYEWHYMVVHAMPTVKAGGGPPGPDITNYAELFEQQHTPLLWKIIRHHLHLCPKQRKGYNCHAANNYEECGK